MNIILLENDEVSASGKVILTGRRAEHIYSVLRAAPGQLLKIGIIDGKIGQGVVNSLTSRQVVLQIEEKMMSAPPSALPLTLVVALQRPPTLRKILQYATSMGVKQFILLGTRRVEKSYWGSKLLRAGELRQQLLLGLEQSGDTIVPQVTFERRFKPFVEDRLPELCRERLALVAHPGGKVPCPYQVKDPVTLLIGPEGGFTEYEIDKLLGVGLQTVTLGERPLRSECAVIATLARLF